MKNKTKIFSIGWADLSVEKQQEIVVEVEKLVLKRRNKLGLILKKEASRGLAESICENEIYGLTLELFLDKLKNEK